MMGMMALLSSELTTSPSISTPMTYLLEYGTTYKSPILLGDYVTDAQAAVARGGAASIPEASNGSSDRRVRGILRALIDKPMTPHE